MTHHRFHRWLAFGLAVLLPTTVLGQTTVLPAGTAIYGELDEGLKSKKRETAVGDIVRARVWRDVAVDGRVVIKAGTPLVTRVSKMKPARMAGRKGEIFLDAVSTTAVDGTEILLDGGYDKSGKGAQAAAWTLFALVAWPLIFIRGKHAVLDPGTVFDASVQTSYNLAVEGASPYRLRVDAGGPTLAVEVLYDEMDPEAKQKVLPINLEACGLEIGQAAVTKVNDKDITPIPVALGSRTTADDCSTIGATIDLKTLAKNFQLGINRFTIEADGATAEVLLEIEL